MIDRRSLALAGVAAAAAGPASALNLKREPKQPPPPPPEPVSFRVSRGQPWTTVEVDGGEPVPFGLNISNTQFHCHPSVVSKGTYKGGQTDQGKVTLGSVRIGGRLVDQEVPCWSSPLAFEGLPIAGFIGLRRYDPFQIDWDRQILTFRAPAPEGWTSLETGSDSSGAGPVVEAMIDGEPARLIVGSYRPWGLELNDGYVRRRKLWDHYGRRRDDFDADGRIAWQSAMIGRLQLADLTFDQVITRLYREETRYRYDENASDGVIGYDLLRRMNLHLDRRRLPGQRLPMLWLAYSGARHAPQADDRAGIAFKAFGNELQVARLDETGPAFRAGVRVGDTVIDAEVEGRTEGLAYALTRPAGTEVPLDILRGEKRMRLVVTLEDRL